MTKREGFTKRMDRNLTAWKARFETERTEAEKAGGDLEKLAATKVAGDAAFTKLGELRVAAARWSELRDEMEVAWQAIAGGPPEAADVADASVPRLATGV